RIANAYTPHITQNHHRRARTLSLHRMGRGLDNRPAPRQKQTSPFLHQIRRFSPHSRNPHPGKANSPRRKTPQRLDHRRRPRPHHLQGRLPLHPRNHRLLRRLHLLHHRRPHQTSRHSQIRPNPCHDRGRQTRPPRRHRQRQRLRRPPLRHRHLPEPRPKIRPRGTRQTRYPHRPLLQNARRRIHLSRQTASRQNPRR